MVQAGKELAVVIEEEVKEEGRRGACTNDHPHTRLTTR